MRRLVRLVSRISSDASPVSPLRMRRSFWDLRWKKCVGLPFDLCAHGCALFLSTPPRAAQWPLRRVLGGQVRRLVPSFLRSPYGSAPPLRYQDSLLLPVRGGTLLASVTSRETHRLDRRRPSFRVRIRLIGIRSTPLQPRPLGCREFLLPSQRFLSAQPRYSAFDTLPARRYAPLSLMTPPFQPSLAASRLDFRAAADLNMGLATSTE
ncbi:hypothetical protein EDB89DRAFT_874668 [Lactarius sanguifluus]|nr:hypothetical protein EDB89DRAFT_874668 [Lactarius sanguifluus]